MVPNQRDFVKAVRKELGLTPTQLGNKLGKPNGYSSANSWETTNAKNFRGLSYEDTMTMLELCGWLNMSEDASENAESPVDPLARIAVGVAALEKGQAEIVRLLREEQEALQSPPRAASKGKK